MTPFAGSHLPGGATGRARGSTRSALGRQEAAQLGADRAQFLEMGGGEVADERFAAGGEVDFEAAAGEPVDEADGAVVAQFEMVGKLADRDVVAAGETLDGKQRLVLLRREAGPPRGLGAEIQVAPQRMAQRGEALVLGGADGIP